MAVLLMMKLLLPSVGFQTSSAVVNCHGRGMEVMGEQKSHLTVMFGGEVGKAWGKLAVLFIKKLNSPYALELMLEKMQISFFFFFFFSPLVFWQLINQSCFRWLSILRYTEQSGLGLDSLC